MNQYSQTESLGADGVETADGRYRVVFTDEPFDAIASEASVHDRADVTDAAGFIHALRNPEIDVEPDRVALTAADSELHLWYRPTGTSEAALVADIEAIGGAYIALHEDRAWPGSPAVGDLRVVAIDDSEDGDGGDLEWRYRRGWVAQYRRGELDDAAFIRRVADTTEVRS